MTVRQPLYYGAGRYTPADDRKQVAAFSIPESDNKRIGGVLPPEGSMKVTSGGGRVVNIAPGFCLIPDAVSPSGTTPGVFLCTVEGSESKTLDTNSGGGSPRTDTIYAVANGGDGFQITAYTATSTEATITTGSVHTFVVGDSVYIQGIDPTFSGGPFTITAVTGTTFTYARTTGVVAPTTVTATATVGNTSSPYGPVTTSVTNMALASGVASLTVADATQFAVGKIVKVVGVHPALDGTHEITRVSGTTVNYAVYGQSDVASTAVSTSYLAKARVPFAIRVNKNASSAPAGTLSIVLATATVSTTDVVTIVDKRYFTTAAGATQLYDSTTGGTDPAAAKGRVAFDLATNTLYYSDGTSWYPVASSSLPAPSSVQVSTTVSITNSSYTALASMSTTITVPTGKTLLCQVQFSGDVTDPDSGGLYISVGTTGTSTIGPTPVAGTSANQISATDGSAYTPADEIYVVSNTVRRANSNRILKLTAGTYSIIMYAKGGIISGAPATVTNSTMRVIPLQYV